MLSEVTACQIFAVGFYDQSELAGETSCKNAQRFERGFTMNGGWNGVMKCMMEILQGGDSVTITSDFTLEISYIC